MKKASTRFLQAVIVLIGILTLFLLLRFPLLEGRATGLDLFSIYADPLILYAYASSVVFFVVLYKVFRLLGYIGDNKAFSFNSVKSLRSIKYCAILLSILILLAGLYIMAFHHEDDDPAGFLALSIVAIFVCLVVAIAAAVFERIFQKAVELKAENDLTI